MSLGSSGFTALQSATSSFALDGVNAAINGISKLTAPNGYQFMSYDNTSQKVSLLGDYLRSGSASIRLDGTSNIVAITSGSNSASNVVLSQSGNYFCSNIGIGTSNSTYGLTLGGACSTLGVDNNSPFYSKNGSGTYEQFLCPRSNDNVMYLNYGSAGLNVKNNAGTTTMFMSSNNYVGIGSTNPNYKLDVAGNANFTNGANVAGAGGVVSFQANPNSSPMAQINGYLNNWGNGTTQDQGGLAFATRAVSACNTSNVPLTTKMLLDNTGNLGIGTTTPAYTLDVGGTARVITSIMTPLVTATTFKCGAGPMNVSSEFDIYYTADFDGNNGGAQHVFYSSSNEKMRLTTAGNLGIGTNNPLYKLDVNGTINTNNTITASNVTVSGTVTSTTVSSSNITATGGITTTGIAKANKLSCGYVSVNDFSTNQSQYSTDLFAY